jgi:hypothetical protein
MEHLSTFIAWVAIVISIGSFWYTSHDMTAQFKWLKDTVEHIRDLMREYTEINSERLTFIQQDYDKLNGLCMRHEEQIQSIKTKYAQDLQDLMKYNMLKSGEWERIQYAPDPKVVKKRRSRTKKVPTAVNPS